MALRLQIENFMTLDDGGPISVAVPPTGLQAGRGAGMGWVLPDASRHISGHHFDIFRQGEAWVLHDRSTNGTFLQGHRHRLDGVHVLRHGDRFQVGQYIIVALIEDEAAAPDPYRSAPLPPFRIGGPLSEPPGQPDDPWAMPGRFEAIDPLPRAAADSPADFASDFVSFPADVELPVPPPGWPGGPPLPEADDPQPVLVSAPGLSVRPGPVAEPPRPVRPAGIGGAPPAPAPPAPPSAPASATAEAAQQASSEVVRAFCSAAGLAPELAEGIDAVDLAGQLGRAVAVSADGLMAALRDRANARHFTRAAERTMRSVSDNNPLKFLPSTEQALEALFLRPRAGFLSGAAGFGEALDDLGRHQTALFAALQPALAELLEDLDPGRIEAELPARGLPAQRKARAWDAYVERWDAKSARENGILDEFIRLFAEAYRAAEAQAKTAAPHRSTGAPPQESS